MLKSLLELVEIPSITGAAPVQDPDYGFLPYGKPVFSALQYVLKLCDTLGFETKNCDNRIGWAQIGEGDSLIGILVHLDVVPPGSGWETTPFSAVVKDGKLYGRGVIDDKGPAIAAIYAMKDLLDTGVKLNKRIRIIFGCQEESGSWEDIAYYKAHEDIPDCGFTPDADFPVIYAEKRILEVQLRYPKAAAKIAHIEGGTAVNTVPDTASLTLCTGEKVSGVGVSAHGSVPEDGKNAIADMLEKIKDIDPFASFYMEKIGFTVFGENLGCCFCDEESGMLTCSASLISGDGEDIIIDLDIRCPVSFTSRQVMDGITAQIAPYGAKATLRFEKPPVCLKKDSPVLRQLLSAYQSVTGDYSSKPIAMGGGTYARAMENIAAFGPLLPGRPITEHSCCEYVVLEDLTVMRHIYKLALQKLLYI